VASVGRPQAIADPDADEAACTVIRPASSVTAAAGATRLAISSPVATANGDLRRSMLLRMGAGAASGSVGRTTGFAFSRPSARASVRHTLRSNERWS
jgi:hypothetical protein